MNARDRLNQKWKFPLRIFSIFLVFFVVLILQLIYLSLSPNIYGINMEKFSSSRNTVRQILEAHRGNIFDINGESLAMNVTSYTVIAYLDESRTISESLPKHVVDPEYTAKILSPIIDMDESYLLSLLKTDLYQVELGPGGRGISELKKDEIAELGLPGIDFVESTKRYYPNGDFASYIIGYVRKYEELETDADGNSNIIHKTIGELGIESAYNEELSGTDGYLEYQRDLQGFKIPDTKEKRIDAKNGNDIYLTIDSSIQMFVEDAIKKEYKEHNPEWLMVGVMDAKNGDVLAMSVTPSFDPNIKDISNYQNLFISSTYEPGSVMKIYTYMCALESGKYKGDLTFLSGSIDILGDKVYDWNKKGWGEITYDKGFEYSSNVGVANILKNFITRNELHSCFVKYGFGNKTGVELSGEASGKIDFKYDLEVANASFGQGITTTAIQQLQALTILSNDGKMLKPHIVDKIVDSSTNDIIYQKKLEESEVLASTETINKIKDLMFNVVHSDDPNATGTSYKVEGFDIIGKTGTAQIYNSLTGEYSTGNIDNIYSFGGMFPKNDPQYIIYVAMKRPSTGSSRGLNEIVKSVTSSIVKYKNMFSEIEDNKNKLNKVLLESYLNKNVESIKNDLTEKGLNVIVLGDGNKVINQYPRKNINLLQGDKILLLTNYKEIKMPNIIGWSRKEVINLLDLLNIEYEIEGSGYVKTVSVAAGSIVSNDTKVTISLESER